MTTYAQRRAAQDYEDMRDCATIWRVEITFVTKDAQGCRRFRNQIDWVRDRETAERRCLAWVEKGGAYCATFEEVAN